MRTRLEWVNQILSNCRLDQYASLEAMTGTEFGRKAIHAYDLSKEWALSMYPWPFALKRTQLIRAQEVPLTTWSYYYHFPQDYGHAWDIYTVQPNFSFRYTGELSAYTGYFNRDANTIAVMEEGYIGSDLQELNMLYTSQTVNERYFSPHFASVLEKEASMRFALQTNMDAAQFNVLQNYLEKKIKESKRSQSLDNPAQQRLSESRMLRRARSGTGVW